MVMVDPSSSIVLLAYTGYTIDSRPFATAAAIL
jgi:hypothetical protein